MGRPLELGPDPRRRLSRIREDQTRKLEQKIGDPVVDMDILEEVAKRHPRMRGKPGQNRTINAFLRSLKEECVWQDGFQESQEARPAIRQGIRGYTEGRPHQAAGYKGPREYRAHQQRSVA